MIYTPSTLRKDIYNVLDKVLETSQPVEILRKGKKVYIVPGEKTDKLSKINAHQIMNLDPEDYVHLDWSQGQGF